MNERFSKNYNVSNLIETVSYYLSSSELDSVYKAVEIAHLGHEGYFRYDDSAYFLHPIGVAQILAEWKAPAKVLVAGLLHDIKKTHYSGLNFQEVTKNFSSEIVDLIEEVNAIDTRFNGDTGEFRVDIQNNSMDKKALWVSAIMRKSPQALIVKIADRLHNSLSINNLPETRKGSFASNSINLFSAISYRLGMANAMRQLQDQSFKGINSSGYDESDEIYNSARLWPQVSELVETIQNALSEKGISARVFPYYTHRYGIHKRKMEGNGKRLQPSEIVSIIVVTENCYVALEPIHKNFQVLHEIKDYIAEPKANGYRALHTKLLKTSWGTFQACILSEDMYKVAEYGLTAAWQGVNTQLLPTIKPLAPAPQKSIMVFTPAGKAVYLPENSCPIDFAYAIHPSLGNRTMFAQVDGRDVPLETILKEGNVVEVITGKGIVGPDTKWLSFVRTDAAKNYIKTWKQKRTKVDLRITAYDRVGLMTEVSSVISSKGYNMKTFRAISADDGNAEIYFRLEDVESKELEKIKTEIESIPNIIEIKFIHDEEFNEPVEFSKVLSSIRNNPFSTQRPATNTFKGREIESNQILRKISGVEKSNTLLIWGQKRIGKTSLLKYIEMHIVSLKRGNILPIYIDLQGTPDAPVERLLFEIMQAVDAKLGSPNISCPNYRRFTIDPLQHFIAFIRTVKKYKKDVRILIIMDEFQGIDKLTEEKLSKSDFFSVLRNLIQHELIVSFILSGGGTRQALQKYTDFTGLMSVIDQIQIKELEREDAKSLMVDTVKEMEMTDEAIDYLLKITNCHPCYIQLICKYLFDRYFALRKRIDLKLIEEVISSQMTIQSNFSASSMHFWEMALDDQSTIEKNKLILIAIADCLRESTQIEMKDITKRLRNFFDESELLQLVDRLLEYGSIVKEKEFYKVRIPLFAMWLQEVYSLENVLRMMKSR